MKGNGQPRVVATTSSDLNGEIRFTGLQGGSYVIAVTDVNNELLTCLGTTAEAAASLSETVPVSLGATNSQNSFGYNQAGLIAGTVYADTDVSFDKDPGEAGFSDVTVTLLLDADANGTFETTVDTVQTGADGLYEFNVNNPGDYHVVVTPPGGTQTEYPEGTPNNQADITLATGQSSVGNDFGYEGVADTFGLSGTVFLDSDKDGVEDTGEIGIQGVTLALISRSTIDSYNVINGMLDINDDGVINSGDDGQADGIAIVDGNFDTSDLNPLETLPVLINLRDVAGSSTNPIAGVREVTQQDAGFISGTALFSIGNRFFFDANRDGIAADDESSIEGITVQCWLDVDQSETPNDPSVGSSSVVPEPGIDNLIRTVVTDENGEYICTSLPNGNYIVVVADTNGFDEAADGTLVTGNTGDNFAKNWSYALTLGIDDPATAVDESTQPNFSADFGVSGNNTLSGLIFVEPENLVEPADGAVVIDPNVNLDGVAGGPSDDSSTNGVDLAATVNVPVDLLLEQEDGSFQVIQTTTSNADGSYNFEGLPDGRYQVRVRPTGTGIDGYGQTGDPDLALIPGADPTDLVCDSATVSLCDNTASTPIDLDSAGANTAGVTESGVDFGYQRGFTTTPVTINFFSATRSAGIVNFVWETSNEVGHAGFQVFARTQEGWQLLNDELLVGNIDVNSEVETKQYVFDARSEAKWFALVDVSNTEQVIARGPFEVGKEYGANLGEKDVFDWSLVQAVPSKNLDEVRELVDDKLDQRANENDEHDPEFDAFLNEAGELDGEAQ